ncbi:MAG: RNA-guided pseudouridylation complex pseudouridine synthase subunit Cbf5 [Thermoplasmata archaeon]|jgi:H/ACA ribonucleoprotein complex subunit 4
MDDVLLLLKGSYVVIDKPYGPTSHQVTSWVKKILNVNKAGHAGTLDPHVTGVLPIGINKGTKVINLLHYLEKEYVGVMRLHSDIDEESIINIFKEFTGEIYQSVPVRSAVSRTIRKRRIYSLKFLEKEGLNVLFKTTTESGTYIRTLCVDVGDALGVGANMVELRRTRTGHITENESHYLQDLVDAYEFYKEGDYRYLKNILRPLEELIKPFPKIWVKDSAVDALANGAPLYDVGITKIEGELKVGFPVAVLTQKDRLIGYGYYTGNEAGKILKMDSILIERGEYPKGWKDK